MDKSGSWAGRPRESESSGAVVGAGGAAGFKGTPGVVVAVSPPSTLAEALAVYFPGGYIGYWRPTSLSYPGMTRVTW
jgi:hypothetical protein